MFISGSVSFIWVNFITIIQASYSRCVWCLSVGLCLAYGRQVIVGHREIRGPSVGIITPEIGDTIPHCCCLLV